MTQDRVSGVAIIVGSLMAVATMALHPVGGSLRGDIDYLTRIAPVAFAVHALALAAIALQAFGFLGFHRALGPGAASVRAGLVAYVMAWIAVFGAALTRGMLGVELIRHYPEVDGAEQAAMHVVWDFTFMINQALDKVWVAGTGIGTILWSLAAWRYGGGWKLACAIGVIFSAIGLVTLFSGRFRFDVTTVGLFVGGYSAWAVLVGAMLCRRTTAG